MDEHGTIIRKKHRRNVTFDHALDDKLRQNPHWATTIKMEDVASAMDQMQSVSTARVVAYTTEEEAFQGVGVTRRWSGLGPEPARLKEMIRKVSSKCKMERCGKSMESLNTNEREVGQTNI